MIFRKEDIFKLDDTGDHIIRPLMGGVSAGFPSPATDFIKESINLNSILVKNPDATFFAFANGDSLIGAGIKDRDLLIIDKQIEPVPDTVAVCYINNELTAKRLKMVKGKLYLVPENDKYKAIPVDESDNFSIWGIVTFSVTPHYSKFKFQWSH